MRSCGMTGRTISETASKTSRTSSARARTGGERLRAPRTAGGGPARSAARRACATAIATTSAIGVEEREVFAPERARPQAEEREVTRSSAGPRGAAPRSIARTPESAQLAVARECAIARGGRRRR